MKLKRTLSGLLLTLVLLALAVGPVFAQESEYRVNVSRNFGYSSGSEIRGTFTIALVGPLEPVQSVTFTVDGQEMTTVTAAPYSFKYKTDDYGFGWHEYAALVTLKDGTTVTTAARRFLHVSQEEEFASVQKIIFPLVGGVLLITLLGVGGQFLFMRQRGNPITPGEARNYGWRGGTICKRCNRPFAIHLFSPHFGPFTLDRCDHCGKVAMVTRYPTDVLRAAEQAEKEAFKNAESSIGFRNLAKAGTIAAGDLAAPESEEDRLRRQLDDSRYNTDR